MMFGAGARLRAGGSIFAVVACISTQAFAQDADEIEATEAQQAEAPADTAIVVTGSRIVRRDFSSNSPIVTVGEQLLESRADFALESALADLPQFAGVATSQFNATQFSTGQSNLNLRNLGANRNLVLLDGRRLQPSGNDFTVDINTLPSILIEDIEVISGGASAVYGSDAAAGVVNFKLKERVNGLETSLRAGITEQGDGETLDFGLLFGTDFSDNRGNVTFALNYSDRGEVVAKDRKFFQEGFREGLSGNSFFAIPHGYYQPGANAPSQAAVDAYFAQFGAAPGEVGSGVNLGFNNDASSLFNTRGSQIYNYTSPLYPENVISNGQVNYNANYGNFISLPLERFSGFARGEYEIIDSVTVFAQGLFTHYTSITQGQPGVADAFWGASVPRDGLHPVPEPLEQLLDSRDDPDARWNFGKTLGFMGQQRMKHESDVFQVMLGAEGDFGNDWTWEIYGSHGESRLLDTGISGYASVPAYQELLNAPYYGQGYSSAAGTCTSGILPFGDNNVEPGSNAVIVEGADNQTPSSLTAPGSSVSISQTVSADCIDFISRHPTNSTNLKQDIVEANVQGTLAELPAGPLGIAMGAAYRRNSYNFEPDALYSPLPTGAAVLAGQYSQSRVGGETEAKEIYGEVLLPIVRNLPLVEHFEIGLGYRWSDYASAGGVSAYKVDANWTVTDGIRIRGGYQRAVRAPNVIELFSPEAQSSSRPAYDPCQSNLPGIPYSNTASNPDRSQVQDLCYAIGVPAGTDLNNYVGANTTALLVFSAGNPDLQPEKADTFTAGVVLSPRWNLPMGADLSLSVDYYNIEIDDAISFATASQAYQLCFNANGISNPNYDPANPYCQTIGRNSLNGNATFVYSLFENQGGIKTSGVDVQLSAAADVGGGTLGLNVYVNHLINYETALAEGATYYDYAGYSGGYYKWKSFTTLNYSFGPATIGLKWQHLSGVKDSSRVLSPCENPGQPGCAANLPSYNLFDLLGSFELTDEVRLQAGVQNLFDKQPPRVNGVAGSTDPSNYDVLGRRYYLGFTAKF